ncbi:hypothetical protein LZ30DRAFT_771788 [Colletotrichum cereale]|nr:hypothetical protein LZ30DRAFT_771788 [Colletotrichum cereale]
MKYAQRGCCQPSIFSRHPICIGDAMAQLRRHGLAVSSLVVDGAACQVRVIGASRLWYLRLTFCNSVLLIDVAMYLWHPRKENWAKICHFFETNHHSELHKTSRCCDGRCGGVDEWRNSSDQTRVGVGTVGIGVDTGIAIGVGVGVGGVGVNRARWLGIGIVGIVEVTDDWMPLPPNPHFGRLPGVVVLPRCIAAGGN